MFTNGRNSNGAVVRCDQTESTVGTKKWTVLSSQRANLRNKAKGWESAFGERGLEMDQVKSVRRRFNWLAASTDQVATFENSKLSSG